MCGRREIPARVSQLRVPGRESVEPLRALCLSFLFLSGFINSGTIDISKYLCFGLKRKTRLSFNEDGREVCL